MSKSESGVNNFDRSEGMAALEEDCAARALKLVRGFAQDGLSVPEQIAIALNMMALSICSGTNRERWDDNVQTCCELLRENVGRAVVN